MRANLELTHGALFSQRALTALIESGMTRDDAYRLVQEAAQEAWDEGTPFRDLLGEAIAAHRQSPAGEAEELARIDLDAVLDPDAYLAHVPEVIARLERLG
jgi:adenylosuccinate lyase